MKKILLLVFIFFLCIGRVNASTSTAASYILMDQTTGRVLDGKNYNEKMLIASITKIMTAILTIENGNLNDVVTVPYDAISTIPAGYSIADLNASGMRYWRL